MHSIPKIKLSCHDRLNQIRFVTKTIQDNNVTNHIGLVYAETEIELSGPISLGWVCDDN